MGNYFSRQGDESIKETINISNETDHVHVTVSNATKTGVINTNENRDENNEAVQVAQECLDKLDVVNFLKPQIKITYNNELDNQDNNHEIIYKKKLKKRKCKKNKKKHLQ